MSLMSVLTRRHKPPTRRTLDGVPDRYRANLKPVPVALEAEYLAAIESEERKMRRAFAEEARAKLGYKALAENLRPPGTLQCTLADLGIPALRRESVAKYKDDERMAATSRSGMYHMVDAAWMETYLNDYSGYVPEGALQMAMDINERLPEAKFMVHHLRVEHRDVDPFLEVRIGYSERFYIAWWDEPNFRPD